MAGFVLDSPGRSITLFIPFLSRGDGEEAQIHNIIFR